PAASGWCWPSPSCSRSEPAARAGRRRICRHHARGGAICAVPRLEAAMYRRILIATDGSELAGKGLDHGLDLARAVGARVVVVTVTEPWMPAFDDALALSADPDMQREYREGCERSAQRILADAAAQAAAAGVACTTVHVPDGHPSDAIVHAAAEHGADLVVMASHGRRGLGKVLLGSQTEAVLARSKVPVLVVR